MPVDKKLLAAVKTSTGVAEGLANKWAQSVGQITTLVPSIYSYDKKIEVAKDEAKKKTFEGFAKKEFEILEKLYKASKGLQTGLGNAIKLALKDATELKVSLASAALDKKAKDAGEVMKELANVTKTIREIQGFDDGLDEGVKAFAKFKTDYAKFEKLKYLA